MLEGDSLLEVSAYLAANNTLSPEAEEILLPFYVPAYYSGSSWDRMQSSSVQAARLAAAYETIVCWRSVAECPILPTWKGVSGANVVVWYQEKYEATDLSKALMLVSEIDGVVWAELTRLMGRTPLPAGSWPEGPGSP